MIERLFSVGLRHKVTLEKLDVMIWAPDVETATYKLVGSLIGSKCEYTWTGSGPVYKDNHVIERLMEVSK